MAIPLSRKTLVALVLATTTVVGCSRFIQRDEFDATIGELRATDARLESQLQGLARDLQSLSDKYEASISRGYQGKGRSEEHASELQSLMRNSSAVFCLKNKN